MAVEYRDLLNRIQGKYKRLSKGQKLIADYILKNYDKVAFMTASNLGKTVGVSESTVVRFADALGYGGYPNLQKALQESIKTKLTTVQRFEFSKDYSSTDDMVKKVMNSDIDNIRKTIDELDTSQMNDIIEDIRNAKKVFIIGLRSSKVLAEYLSFYFNLMLDDVHLIPSGANDAFDQLVNISENDVLISISFPRYSKRTFEVVEFAQNQGATIIGITDSAMSPISKYVKYILTAKYTMTTFIDSLVAPMSLLNSLIIALSTTEKDRIKQNFDLLEQIWEKNAIYSHDESDES